MKTKQRLQASKLAAIAEEKRDILVKKATEAAKEIKEKVETKMENVEEKIENLGKKTGIKSTMEKVTGKVAQMIKHK